MNKKRIRIILGIMMLTNIGTALFMHNKKHKEASINYSPILGDWSGILDVGLMKMHTVLHIQKNAEGKLSATLDNLSVKALGIPIDIITFNDNQLQFEMTKTSVTFEGILSKDEKEISGKVIQNGQEFSLSLEKGLKAIGHTNRPQEPVAPYPYKEELVSYENTEAGITLSGTLTIPSSNGTFPAVLLIAGSGPHDRDETVFGHKPFLVLADYLTRQGIAVLRVDKRGCGKSTGHYDTATSQDFAEDVQTGIAYLKSLPKINPEQIGLIGHSEGGIIAPMVAAKSQDIAFLVLAGGPAATGDEILYEQNALLLQASGESKETIDELNTFQRQIFAILKKGSDLETTNRQLQEITKNYLELPQENQKQSIIALLNGAPKLFTPWFCYFLNFDPSTALKQVQVPVLAINGELDLQVSAKQNLPIISKALKEAGNTDYTTLELPKLNHLLQTCQTGHVREYGEIEETISPSVLELISGWILERTVQKTSG